MVKTKSVRDPVEESDGERILVTRYPDRSRPNKPPFVTEWAKELAPSASLLNDWKAGKISWNDYERRYFEEMSHQQDKIRELAGRAARGIITLLCFEPEEDRHCHRHLLKRLIESSALAKSRSGRRPRARRA